MLRSKIKNDWYVWGRKMFDNKVRVRLPETCSTCIAHTSRSKPQIPVLTYETPLATHLPSTPPSTKEKTHTHAHTSLSSCVIIKLFWTSHWKSNATCVSTRQMYCSWRSAPISSLIQPFLPHFQAAPNTIDLTPQPSASHLALTTSVPLKCHP